MPKHKNKLIIKRRPTKKQARKIDKDKLYQLMSTDPDLYDEITAREMLGELDAVERKKRQQRDFVLNDQDQNINDNGSNNDYTEMEPAFTLTKASSKTQRFNEPWEKNCPLIKQWFLESSSYGKSDPTLKTPHAIQSKNCSCQKKTSDINVYMMHNFCIVKVEHYNCRSLVQTLILMHVFPTSTERPENGCHFALLSYLHLLKTHSQLSNQAFTNVVNHHLLTLNDLDAEYKKLSKIVLNFCYQAFQKVKDR